MSRDDAICFDLSEWSQITITGEERREFLHNFCTNNIKRLQPGQGCEAFVPDIRGRILGHVLVFATDSSLRLVAVPGSADAIAPHLRKYLLGNDAEVQVESPDMGMILLIGEQLDLVLQSTLNTMLPEEPGANVVASFGDSSLLIGRCELTPSPGVLIMGPQITLNDLRDSWEEELVHTGTPEGFNRLRIEAGFPWHGRDLSIENIAQEAARTDRAVSFTKGCYLGQEPIARLDAMGHTNRELRRVQADGVMIIPGAKVSKDGEDVGTISSFAANPESGTGLGLAMLKTKANRPGTEVQIQAVSKEGDVRGIVESLIPTD